MSNGTLAEALALEVYSQISNKIKLTVLTKRLSLSIVFATFTDIMMKFLKQNILFQEHIQTREMLNSVIPQLTQKPPYLDESDEKISLKNTWAVYGTSIGPNASIEEFLILSEFDPLKGKFGLSAIRNAGDPNLHDAHRILVTGYSQISTQGQWYPDPRYGKPIPKTAFYKIKKQGEHLTATREKPFENKESENANYSIHSGRVQLWAHSRRPHTLVPALKEAKATNQARDIDAIGAQLALEFRHKKQKKSIRRFDRLLKRKLNTLNNTRVRLLQSEIKNKKNNLKKNIKKIKGEVREIMWTICTKEKESMLTSDKIKQGALLLRQLGIASSYLGPTLCLGIIDQVPTKSYELKKLLESDGQFSGTKRNPIGTFESSTNKQHMPTGPLGVPTSIAG